MKQFYQIIGDFHPLAVHLPIGIFAVIFFFELLFYFKKYELEWPAKIWLQWMAFLTIGVSIFFGWCNASVRTFPGSEHDIVEWHERLSFALWFLSFIGIFCAYKNSPKAYRYVLIGSLTCLTITGHLGSILVHGEVTILKLIFNKEDKGKKINFTIPPVTKKSPEIKPPILSDNYTKVKTTISYKASIQPIFENYCYDCHGTKKQKGDLRMDKIEEFQHYLVATSPKDSDLFMRITLPADDEDLMPSKGGPMPPEAIAIIKKWIEEGANTDN